MSDAAPVEILPPPRHLFLAELPRAAMMLGSFALSQGRLNAAPRGDGRPVLVLPGLGNTDNTTIVMRRWLKKIGYRSYGWELGRNRGARTIGSDGNRLEARLEAIYADAGAPVTLVGISLGGIMARMMAHRRSELVREVVTLSSPFAGPPTATNVWRAFQWLSGEKIDDPAVIANRAEAAAPLPVPSTAIWSASDGFVNGAICREADGGAGRSIEIESGHLGVHMHPDAMLAIAQALAGETN
ncbi:esterase/lipase family protein [Sphingosinithalassobacter portus]|uniref:esterase/lipase family protein n=1 Tax=Stakelama portus TaxID=2676234 RepID=UPI001EFE1CC3|nr:GPI inositol-deacylase [Sphingosinithalassobacter portus]